jgi:hypothetical protein
MHQEGCWYKKYEKNQRTQVLLVALFDDGGGGFGDDGRGMKMPRRRVSAGHSSSG